MVEFSFYINRCNNDGDEFKRKIQAQIIKFIYKTNKRTHECRHTMTATQKSISDEMSRYHYALSISSVKLITEVRTSVIFREFKRQTYTYQGFNASIISMTRDIISIYIT